MNLNRYYGNPTLSQHPAQFLLKELVNKINKEQQLLMYIDLHAHATKRGCFIFGNQLDLNKHVQSCLFPKILSLNSPIFDYDSCNFTERNMLMKDKGEGLSKEGSARVALYKATNLSLIYTLECNYNSGVREFDLAQMESSVVMQNPQANKLEQLAHGDIKSILLNRHYLK